MLARKQIEEQTIVEAAVDRVALALPAVVTKLQTLHQTPRRVAVHNPRVDGMEPKLLEREREEPRARERAVPAATKRLLARGAPKRGRAEVTIDVVEPRDADRPTVVVRIRADKMRVALRHDLQQRRRHDLLAAAEVEPLIVFLARKPLGNELEQRV